MKTNPYSFRNALRPVLGLAVLSLIHGPSPALLAQGNGEQPPGTAFTYQGRLTVGGNPSTNGIYDFEFRVFDTNTVGAGNSYGSPNPNVLNAVGVTNGMFTAPLDFGAGVFGGLSLWLEVSVRTNGSGAFTTLSPRTPLNPVPYAIYAENAATLGGQSSSAYVAKSGDTMSGALGVGINADTTLAVNGDVHIFGGSALYFEGGPSDPNYFLQPYPTATAAGMRLKGFDGVRLATGYGDILYVLSEGVGIGTSTPQAALEVDQTAATGVAVKGLDTSCGAFGELGVSSAGNGGEFPYCYGVYGNSGGGSGGGTFAGYFDGPVSVNGTVSLDGTVQVDSSGISVSSGNLRVGLPALVAPLGVSASLSSSPYAFTTPVAYIENTHTGAFSSPALRLVGYGYTTNGVLSVSAQGTGFIAQFGNAIGFVADIRTNGTIDALAFNTTSDRHAKEDFQVVDCEGVLAKVAALPISRWRFKTDPGTHHIGPMAQDFHAAFAVGSDDKHIATVDEEGVALAAIQGLNQKLEQVIEAKGAQIEALSERNKSLERRLADLEQAVTSLTANRR